MEYQIKPWSLKDILENPRTIFPFIRKQYPLPGYRIMGKTGTARVLVDGAYSDKHHVYSFAGIVEKDSYKRVIVTFVNQPEQAGLWASQVTAPLFMRIAERMVVHDVLSNATNT